MAWQRFNTGPHRASLHFGNPDAQGRRFARHAQWGTFEVSPADGGLWAASVTRRGLAHPIGTAASCGLAMSLCAQHLENL